MSENKRQKGAAVVEFAVLAALLIVFLFGIFEFGFLWLSSYHIANSAREGARVAAKTGEETADESVRKAAAENAVEQYLKGQPIFAATIDEVGYDNLVNPDYNEIKVPTSVKDVNVSMSVVTVKVQTWRIWDPLLWPLLRIFFSGDDYSVREISRTASFAIE